MNWRAIKGQHSPSMRSLEKGHTALVLAFAGMHNATSTAHEQEDEHSKKGVRGKLHRHGNNNGNWRATTSAKRFRLYAGTLRGSTWQAEAIAEALFSLQGQRRMPEITFAEVLRKDENVRGRTRGNTASENLPTDFAKDSQKVRGRFSGGSFLISVEFDHNY